MKLSNYDMSSYLTFRYIINPSLRFCGTEIEVETADDIYEVFGGVENICNNWSGRVGILLSGGIDSGILSYFLPEGTKAFTVNFKADSDVNEEERAREYVERNKLEHHIIEVGWEDYIKYEPVLMEFKHSPLHPIEVALYKASLKAKELGVDLFFIGNGADSNFGGMDKLLSRDWSFDEFVERYSFVNPFDVLKNPVDMNKIYRLYERDNKVDVISFLNEIHGEGITRTFENAICGADIMLCTPYEMIKLKNGIDIDRIRKGEPKYILVELFKKLYPDLNPPAKIPFVRPMEEWFENGFEIKSDIFKNDLDLNKFSGEQKYLLYCLDKYVNKYN